MLAVYKVNQVKSASEGTLKLAEHHMYGSSRLGIINRDLNMDNVHKHTPEHVDELGDTYLINFTRGNKLFEVTNHLGNVMLTVTDKRDPQPVAGNPSVIASYKADVVSAADYSPFGMTLPGRVTNNHWQKYRYGFNGKESDSEVNGPYNELDYGMRVYEPRLGKFFSVDPLTRDYPMLTPYQYASNSPIWGVDVDGGELKISNHYYELDVSSGEPKLKNIKNETHFAHEGGWFGVKNFFLGKGHEIHYNLVDGRGNQYGYPSDSYEKMLAKANHIAALTRGDKDALKDEQMRDIGRAVGMFVLTYAMGEVGGMFSPSSGITPSEKFSKENQSITLKETWVPKDGGSVAYSIQGGKINLASRSVTNGKFDFVVTKDGKLVIGSKHFALSDGAESVQAAGTLKIYKGKVMTIDNNSGHYKPNAEETKKFGEILKNLGVDISGTKLNTLNSSGEKVGASVILE